MREDTSNSEIEALVAQAKAVRENAYAPYSKFLVGAALRSRSGRVFAGCNVENLSFGLTICAERVCIGAAVAAGETEFEMIAIFSDSKMPVMPCGACRQVLAEFAPSLRVFSVDATGTISENRLDVLLPLADQGILG